MVLAKARPKVEDGEIDFRLGVRFDKTADAVNLVKRLNAVVNEKVAAIKRYINTNGRDPLDVLGGAVSDSNKVSFFGEEHTQGGSSRELLQKVLEKGSSKAIFTPEFPQALRPLFDQYNASPKDTKFTLPDNLEQLVGKKAAAYCRFNEDIIGSASLFEAAHKSGKKIIPMDDSATMDVLDVIPPDMLQSILNKQNLDNDPRMEEVAIKLNKAISQFLRGGEKNPARERTIAKNLLAIAKEFPDSPLIAQTGRTHAAEHTPNAKPAAQLLAEDPEFKKTGKEVLSFATYDYENEMIDHSLATFAKELDRPVCFPTQIDNSNPLRNLPEFAQVTMDNYDLKLNGPFLKDEITAGQNELLVQLKFWKIVPGMRWQNYTNKMVSPKMMYTFFKTQLAGKQKIP